MANSKRVCRCKVCGRPLKNAESRIRGMGPTCERKVLGVVRGVQYAKKAPKKTMGWNHLALFPELEDVK